MIWETEAVKLQVDVKLNTGGKVSGARVEEDINLEDDMLEVMPDVITKRIIWRVAMAQYDPLRLLCIYTVKFKILMRTMTKEETGEVLYWDSPAPQATADSFLESLSELKEVRKTKFPRTFRPEASLGRVDGKPMIMMFGDGSREACCALAYARWKMTDGSVVCRLIAGKTRVALCCKVTIPRMELVGAVLAVRLAVKIKDALQMEFGETRYFTDSSAVLCWACCSGILPHSLSLWAPKSVRSSQSLHQTKNGTGSKGPRT